MRPDRLAILRRGIASRPCNAPTAAPTIVRDGVVVLGVVDGSDDRLFGVVAVTHENVNDRRHCFEQIGARVPAVADIPHRQPIAVCQRHKFDDEAVDWSAKRLVRGRSGAILLVAFERAGDYDEPVEPPGGVWRGSHGQQIPQHGDKSGAAGGRAGVVVHSPKKLAHGGADAKDAIAREPPGEVFWHKAVVREQLLKRPERELTVVGWKAAPLVGVAMKEIIPGLFIGP